MVFVRLTRKSNLFHTHSNLSYVRMNSRVYFVLCVAIGLVALITVSNAATVIKEFTCDYSTQDGCMATR